MNDLIAESMKAHGGLETWRALKSFKGHTSGGGPLFEGVGYPEGIRDISFFGLCHEQQMSQWPIGTSRTRSLIKPDHESLENEAGEIVAERADPRHGYPSSPDGGWAKWDDLNLAYFMGYSMWNYLNVPFIWTWPGVETEELASVEDGGETLRRLLVRYPMSIASHSREETFYFSDRGLIVRVDYAPDVIGGRLAANFASEYREVPGGLIMPLRRTIKSRHPDGTVADMVAIDVTIDQLEYA